MPTVSERAGRLVVAERGADGFSAFIPALLAPESPIRIEPATQALLDEANQALGRLDGLAHLLPDGTRTVRSVSERPSSAR